MASGGGRRDLPVPFRPPDGGSSFPLLSLWVRRGVGGGGTWRWPAAAAPNRRPRRSFCKTSSTRCRQTPRLIEAAAAAAAAVAPPPTPPRRPGGRLFRVGVAAPPRAAAAGWRPRCAAEGWRWSRPGGDGGHAAACGCGGAAGCADALGVARGHGGRGGEWRRGRPTSSALPNRTSCRAVERGTVSRWTPRLRAATPRALGPLHRLSASMPAEERGPPGRHPRGANDHTRAARTLSSYRHAHPDCERVPLPSWSLDAQGKRGKRFPSPHAMNTGSFRHQRAAAHT